MDDLTFCPKCGRRRGEGEEFCPKCGRAYNSPNVADQGSAAQVIIPAASLAALHLRPSQKPGWPWLMVVAGLLGGGYFGLQTWTAFEVMRRVEASNAVTIAKGVDWLGRLFGVQNAGQMVDPRYQQVYITAQEQFRSGLLMVGLFAGVALLGLFILASWQPRPELAAVPAPRAKEGRLAVEPAAPTQPSSLRRQVVAIAGISAVILAGVWLWQAPRWFASPTIAATAYRLPDFKIENVEVPARGSALAVIAVPRQGATVEGYFLVRGGGNDVDFQILTPGQRAIDTRRRAQNRYDFRFTAPEAGTYWIRFDNGFSLLTRKSVTVYSRAY
ncbi:MAG: emp24/gp25L/p24 family protein [Chloroflexi bacterium]|nr:emp24/gp25L/p24 family protein [Chloroflexota bacterium]MCL5107931.1 emp24/gp25L/p24 family protein [Chloroflexota bacterium]